MSKKKRTVVKYTDKDGNKIKSVERRSGKRVETSKNKATGVKSRQVSKNGVVKKTVTRTPGGVEKEIERGNKRIEVRKYKDEGVKSRQVSKNGVIKKTVTRTPGAVEKEIERGNKRIEVGKYKDEGVKSRTVTNMKKNEQYQNDLKGSAFNKFPQQVYDNAMKNKK